MNLIAKLVTAAQALLLAQLGAVKSGDAATPSDLTEATEWDAAISAGTPEAFQQYISQFPRGERLGEAFELIVLSEIATAKSLSDAAVSDIQLSEARREDLEVLERNFDLGTRKTDESQSEESGRLGPY